MSIPVTPVAPVAPIEPPTRDGPSHEALVRAWRTIFRIRKRNTQEGKEAYENMSNIDRKELRNEKVHAERERIDSRAGGDPRLCGGEGPRWSGTNADAGREPATRDTGGEEPLGGLPDNLDREAGVFVAA